VDESSLNGLPLLQKSFLILSRKRPQVQHFYTSLALFKDLFCLPTVAFFLKGPVILLAKAPSQLLTTSPVRIDPGGRDCTQNAHQNHQNRPIQGNHLDRPP